MVKLCRLTEARKADSGNPQAGSCAFFGMLPIPIEKTAEIPAINAQG
jgi:hypothetical protein